MKSRFGWLHLWVVQRRKCCVHVLNHFIISHVCIQLPTLLLLLFFILGFLLYYKCGCGFIWLEVEKGTAIFAQSNYVPKKSCRGWYFFGLTSQPPLYLFLSPVMQSVAEHHISSAPGNGLLSFFSLKIIFCSPFQMSGLHTCISSLVSRGELCPPPVQVRSPAWTMN